MMSDQDQTAVDPEVVLDEATPESQKAEAEPTETERRLRKEMTKLREQARSAQTERDAAIVSMRAENDARLIKAELRVAATRSGIIDIDALRLIDPAELVVGPNGSIEGADAAITSLKSLKPYLFEETRHSGPGLMTTSQPRRPPVPAQPDAVDARTLTRDQWQAERARVLARTR